MRISILIFCVIFCIGCETTATEKEKENEIEKVDTIEDLVIGVEGEIVITGEDIDEYMKEIAYSHSEDIEFNTRKRMAVKRAIEVAVIDIYFREKGIFVSDEEIDVVIARQARHCGMSRKAFLAMILEDFRYSEIKRIISIELRTQKLITEMVEKGSAEDVARKRAEEEINERIRNAEVVFFRPLREGFLI